MEAKRLELPCKGFDTPARMTPKLVKAFVDDGYKFVMRYVARKWWTSEEAYHGGWLYQISYDEARIITDGGLGLGIVQSFANCELTREHGNLIGTIAVANLLKVGITDRVHLFCDLEHKSAFAEPMIEYLNGWSEAVHPYFRCGLYVGYEGLSGSQLYKLPRFNSYWASAMKYIKTPDPRGYCMRQGYEDKVHGIGIDPDELTGDKFGHSPYFLMA